MSIIYILQWTYVGFFFVLKSYGTFSQEKKKNNQYMLLLFPCALVQRINLTFTLHPSHSKSTSSDLLPAKGPRELLAG